MKKFILFYLSITLSCALMISCSTPQTVIGPDGTEHVNVTCVNMTGCYKMAREVCQGPYEIIDTSDDVSGTHYLTTSHDMLVKCATTASDIPLNRVE